MRASGACLVVTLVAACSGQPEFDVSDGGSGGIDDSGVGGPHAGVGGRPPLAGAGGNDAGRGGAGGSGGSSGGEPGLGGAAGATGAAIGGSGGAGAGGAGAGGAEPAPDPECDLCGDGCRDETTEACDDGNLSEGDACDDTCSVSAVPVTPLSASGDERVVRELSDGGHRVSTTPSGFAVAFVEETDGQARVMIQAFDPHGVRVGMATDVSAGARPISRANPVVAGLDDGSYVVAWTDRSRASQDVMVRRVVTDGAAPSLSSLVLAHEPSPLAERDADLRVVDDRIVVTWTDGTASYAREFDAELSPLANTRLLGEGSSGPVSIAIVADAPAFTWVSSAGGFARVNVRVFGETWHSAEFLSGPEGQRPAVVPVDEARAAVLYYRGLPEGGFVGYYAVLEQGGPSQFEGTPVDDLRPLDIAAEDSAWASIHSFGSSSLALVWMVSASDDVGGLIAATLQELALVGGPSASTLSVASEHPIALPARGSDEPRDVHAAFLNHDTNRHLALLWEDGRRMENQVSREIMLAYYPLPLTTPGAVVADSGARDERK